MRRYFFDGRLHLKQNLTLLLRAANGYSPLAFTWWTELGSYGPHYLSTATNYAYASFIALDLDYFYWHGNDYMPFIDNYLLRNFVFTPLDMDDNGEMVTGPQPDGLDGEVVIDDLWIPAKYRFPGPPADGSPIPALLSTNDSRWTFYPAYYLGDGLTPIGVSWDDVNYLYSMAGSAVNIYGLPYLAATLAYPGTSGPVFTNLNAGSTIYCPDAWWIYPQTAQPQLSTNGYYFAPFTRFSSPSGAQPPIPGTADFSPTNTSPVLLAGFGAVSRFAGYAKLVIVNGDSNKFAYLGQYFDKALKINNPRDVQLVAL